MLECALRKAVLRAEPIELLYRLLPAQRMSVIRVQTYNMTPDGMTTFRRLRKTTMESPIHVSLSNVEEHWYPLPFVVRWVSNGFGNWVPIPINQESINTTTSLALTFPASQFNGDLMAWYLSNKHNFIKAEPLLRHCH